MDADLDQAQWERLRTRSLEFKKKCDGIKQVVFEHTIEPYKLFVRLDFDDNRSEIWEMTVSNACLAEFPKCEVLAETVFKR